MNNTGSSGKKVLPFGEIPPLAGNEEELLKLSSTWNYHYEPNQLHPELANVLSMVPFENTVSASRKQMFGASHITQCLVINKPTPPRIQTGAEMKYGRATFSTKVDRDCRVISIIPFYKTTTMGIDTIKKNPEDIVLVEYQDGDGEIDYISIKEYFSNHQYFGFRYKNSTIARNMHGTSATRDGTALRAGTILQDSPSKRDDGQYCIGINLNTVFGSFPEVAEDGIVISEEIVDWLKTRKYEKRTFSFGSTHWALNIYGDETNYKPFPDIGDYVREDGILCAARSYNDTYSPVEMSANASRNINHIFDRLTMVPSAKKDSKTGTITSRGRVIDVRVMRDASKQPFSPTICNTQALKYDSAAREFYRELLRQYNVMKANRPKTGQRSLKVSHRLKNLLRHAHAILQQEMPNTDDQRVQMQYRGTPMDDFTVEFVIEYEVSPTEGYKLTDKYGGKGVVVKVWKKEDMPIDRDGNRAHIIMDGGATISRSNYGRLYVQFYNAAGRDVTKKFCDLFDVAYPPTHGQKLSLADKMRVESAFKGGALQEQVNAAWNRLIRFYEIVNENEAQFYRSEAQKGLAAEHMIAILEDGIYIHMPINNDRELPDAIEMLSKEFMPHMSPLTYRDHNGEFIETIDPILVGEVEFIMLEKTGDDWTSVSSGRLQSIGILSHINNQDKFASPWRQQSIRAWGETETAIGASYMGAHIMAEIHDRNNNIISHRYGVYNILRSDNPSDIDELVDRTEIPLGNDKPLELVYHMTICAGWKFAYKPYVETEPKPTAIKFIS